MSNDWKANVQASYNRFNKAKKNINKSNNSMEKVKDNVNDSKLSEQEIKNSIVKPVQTFKPNDDDNNPASKKSDNWLEKTEVDTQVTPKNNDIDKTLSKDVQILREVDHEYQVWQGFDKNTPEAAQVYQRLLIKAYDYYKVTGNLLSEYLPKNVDLAMLVQMYHQAHKDAFNLQVQTEMHSYVYAAVKLLRQLEGIADKNVAITSYEQLRDGFNQQLQSLLINGFAMDLFVYQEKIRPYWLIIKNARRLSIDNFRPLIKVLDYYTRLEVVGGQHVVYQPDDAHKEKSDEDLKMSNVNEESKTNEAISQAPLSSVPIKENSSVDRSKRLSFAKNDDGQLVVSLPKKDK